VRRRQFIHLLGITAAWPLAVQAQKRAGGDRVARIGVLWHAGSEDEEREYYSVLMQAFRDLGYVQGKNAEFLHRYPAERIERFEQLAKDLVDSKTDVILAVNIRGAAALKRITRATPVVFVLAADPVAAMLVDSLAHPGGNMTGLSLMHGDLSGKRVARLKEAVPGLKRVAFVIDPSDPNSHQIGGARKTVEALGLSSGEVRVSGPEAVEEVFAAIAKEGYDGAMIGGSMFFNERKRVGAAALANKVPTISLIAEAVPYGLLMSYGPDFPEFFRRAAGYADRILKGANPADLPVEQPTRFRQVLNLKAAKTLGLTISQSLLVNTDETIE
jgi:putative tryptophan/tyrosine transport system substrate-binding protein